MCAKTLRLSFNIFTCMNYELGCKAIILLKVRELIKTAAKRINLDVINYIDMKLINQVANEMGHVMDVGIKQGPIPKK